MPTITASTGVFILDVLNIEEGSARKTDLRYGPKRAIAYDICKSESSCRGVPVSLDCSLACTAIGWPMISGVLTIDMFRRDDDCPSPEELRSLYFNGGVGISLGCPPTSPVVDGNWQGVVIQDGIVLAGPPARGLTIQFCGKISVNEDATVSATVELSRIVLASEIFPPPANGLNVIVPCGSVSANLTRIVAPGTTPLINEPWYLGHEGVLSFTVTGENCPLDVHSAKISLTLIPYKVGCDGTADGYAQAQCSLNTGYRTYSCFSVLTMPTTAGTFKPVWKQLGVNGKGDASINGCFFGGNGGSTLVPPTAGSYGPMNANGYPTVSDILNCGCAGESTLVGDRQEIQFTDQVVVDIMPEPKLYDIVIKSVNRGPPCIAMRLNGTGNPWTVGAYTVNSSILDQTGHWIATATFTGLTGNPIAICYGMEFPSGITADCVPIPSLMTEPVVARQLTPPEPKPEKPIHPARLMANKMRLVQTNPCIHLGEALETKASCGCGGGGVLRKCAIHGKCRVSGNTVDRNCWKCDDYSSSQER
jgi:hypothetical protein